MWQTSGRSLLWKVSPLRDVMLLQFAVRSWWPRSLYGRPWTFQDHNLIVIKTETRPSHTSHFSPLGCDSSCLARLAASSWGPAAAEHRSGLPGHLLFSQALLTSTREPPSGPSLNRKFKILGMQQCLRQPWCFLRQSSEKMDFQR